MNARKRALLTSVLAAAALGCVTMADAADGTLKVAFKYTDPNTGVVTKLPGAYVYLRSAAVSPPMEKFFSKADFILGPADYNGVVIKPVPAGNYFIRITKRLRTFPAWPPGGAMYGPPEEGDYTWMQPIPITITAGQTLDLGTKYAYPFGGAPITISGTVTNYSGAPLPGRYVRVSKDVCTDWWNYGYINNCGPDVFHARPTDANGAYTIYLRDPGTYYLYVHSSWDTSPGCSGYCSAPVMGAWRQTLTVQLGDRVTANMIGW